MTDDELRRELSVLDGTPASDGSSVAEVLYRCVKYARRLCGFTGNGYIDDRTYWTIVMPLARKLLVRADGLARHVEGVDGVLRVYYSKERENTAMTILEMTPEIEQRLLDLATGDERVRNAAVSVLRRTVAAQVMPSVEELAEALVDAKEVLKMHVECSSSIQGWFNRHKKLLARLNVTASKSPKEDS